MVDERAATGFTYADAYSRGRPGYPDAALERVVADLGLDERSTVLDLAAGTGQVSRGLCEQIISVVIAMGPSAAFRRHLAERQPTVRVVAGVAEAIPVRTAGVDAVVVGEAFHWFDIPAAGAEIARVLTRAGGLALMWNTVVWTEQDCPWLPALRALLAEPRRAAGDFPAGNGLWRARLDDTALFGPMTHTNSRQVQHLPPEGFVAMVASWSWITNLPAPRRATLLEQVEQLMAPYRRPVPHGPLLDLPPLTPAVHTAVRVSHILRYGPLPLAADDPACSSRSRCPGIWSALLCREWVVCRRS